VQQRNRFRSVTAGKMKLLSVAACIFILTTAAYGDKVPAKNDGDDAPAPSSSPVQDTSADEVISPEEDKAEYEMELEDEAVDEMESDEETEDMTENEDEDDRAVLRDDQEFDDDEKTIGADEVKDAKPIFQKKFWTKEVWTIRRRRCKYTHKKAVCVGKNGKKCKCPK